MAYGVIAYGDTPAGKAEAALKAAKPPTDWGTAFGNALATSIQAGNVKPFQPPATPVDKKINTAPATPAAPQMPMMPAAPDTFMADMTKNINDLYNNRFAAGRAQLGMTRDTALQGLTGQETTAHQGAYANRNSADVSSIQALQQLREEMARNGLLASGDNVTANVGLQTARENVLGNINQQEGNAIQDISQKRSLIGNQAATQEQALQQELDAQKAAELQDLIKYGDTRAFRDSQAAFDHQTRLAELTGQLGDKSTLAGKQANLNAALQVGDRTGQLISPTTDWSQLFSQPNAPLTMAGQQQQLQKTQIMAQLTGRMPDGTPTSTEQQRQLENMWTVATQTGTVPDQLADLYKLPRGTQTTAALAHAATLQNQNMNQLMDVWRANGKAPAGLESMGIQAGTPYYDATANRQANQGNTAEDYQTSTVSKISKYDTYGKLSNPTQVESTILLSPLSDYEKYKAYTMNGLKWDGPIPAKPVGN